MRPEKVTLFAAMLRAGLRPPPIRVRRADLVGSLRQRWLVCDGAHRLAAAKAEGLKTVECEGAL